MAKGNKATDKLPADYMSKVKKWNDAVSHHEYFTESSFYFQICYVMLQTCKYEC